MRHIPAVVLTFDRNRPYVDHMIACYQELWPAHPFVFHVPFQENDSFSSRRITPLRTPRGIRDTLLLLMDRMKDSQWIYWCMDDKYPIAIDVLFHERMVRFIESGAADGIDGVCACRARALKGAKGLRTTSFGLFETQVNPFIGAIFRRRNYRQIWLHQFVRAGVLRRLFEAFPASLARAKDLDAIKDGIPLPDEHRLYVTRASHVTFGESLSRGVVTANCLASMEARGLAAATQSGTPAGAIVIGEAGRRYALEPRWRNFRDTASTWFAKSPAGSG